MRPDDINSAARNIVSARRGKWYGGGYGMILCPAHEEKHPSCRIRPGERTILVSCYAQCDRVDIIASLVRLNLWPSQTGDDENVTMAGELRRETRQAFCVFDGVKEIWLPKSMVEHDRGRFTLPAWLAKEKDMRNSPAARRYAPATPPFLAPRRLTPEDQQRVDFALGIWRETAGASGTIVARYWHEARGIILPIPDVIRFGEAIPYGTKPDARRYPGMVAMVQAPDGAFAGVHVTYLVPDGSDKRRDVPESRLAFGSLGGCAIRLAPAVDELAIGEGIESTASYMADFGVAGWAALNTSGLANIVLPPPPLAFAVTLLGENDEAKGKRQIVASDAAIQKATARLRLEGRLVGSVYPAEEWGDFNDPHRKAA